MKRLMLFLVILFSFAVMRAQDSSVVVRGYYKCVLTAAVDTFDFKINVVTPAFNYISISAKSTVADTVQAWTLSADGVTWEQVALIDLSNFAPVASMVLSTTQKKFILANPQTSKLRLISTSDDVSKDTVIVSGVYGSPLFGGIIGGTAVNTSSVKDSTTFVDTVRISFTQVVSAYVAGDMYGASFYGFTAARSNGGGGYLISFTWETDTASVGTITWLIFTDTTGFTAGLPGNNGVYTSKFDLGKYYVGEVVISQSKFGTSGGARGYTSCLIPYKCKSTDTKLYVLGVLNSGYTGNRVASSRLRIYSERN